MPLQKMTIHNFKLIKPVRKQVIAISILIIKTRMKIKTGRLNLVSSQSQFEVSYIALKIHKEEEEEEEDLEHIVRVKQK